VRFRINELAEPFDAIVPAGRAYEEARRTQRTTRRAAAPRKTYLRRLPTENSDVRWNEDTAAVLAPAGATSSALLDLNSLCWDSGSSKTLVVPPAGPVQHGNAPPPATKRRLW